MEQSNNYFKSAIYVVAALAGAGLIIYGAFFYSKKPNASTQPAQVLPASEENQIANTQPKKEINFSEPFLGEANAPVTMIEYGSYLCGHCISFGKNTFPKIEEEYIKTGKVKFIYRSFPPLELGIAALCANDQNKFWEYHEYAINNQIKAEDDLKNFAKEVDLNTEQFNKCLDEKKYNDQAQAWYDAGQADGVQGTPSFMINGKNLVGEQPYEKFQETINAALAEK